MERHQDVRDKVPWLTTEDRPLALVFISHRWETLQHPDPTGRQLRVIQEFLRRICTCVEAVMVPARERLQLVPSLSLEGTLQAEEVVRRMLCFGPFADASPCIGGHGAKRIVKEQFRVHSGGAFYAWLASKIGVWLDYTCMPQRPLSAKDEPEFRRSLAALDSLVMSSTVVALRQADDDYAVRGWCASEFFLASNRSFSRGLFLDMARIENGKEVLIPDPPAPAGGAADAATKAVMMESYEQDLTAFHEACSQWSSFEGPLLDITVPDPWSSYRALQGSSFQAGDSDPNPFRRALEAIRGIETGLIENWLMSEQSRTIHIGKDVWDALQRVGLHCSEPSDLTYLGFLLACHGWIEAFRPLFRECLRAYLETAGQRPIEWTRGAFPIINVALQPLDESLRSLFTSVTPSSPATWNSRLSSRLGGNPHESAVIDQVRKGLNERPPGFVLEKPDGHVCNRASTLGGVT